MSPMPAQQWVFRASLARVVDGDTLDLIIDAGMHDRRVERVRLLGVNTPEVRGVPDRAPGLAAAAYVRQWLALATFPPWDFPLVIQTTKTDDFGRYLADVWRGIDGAHLNDDLLTSGHAVPYPR